MTEALREGAQKLIAKAVQAEPEGLLEQYEDQQDELGRQRLVRNGYLLLREAQTWIGGVPVRIPRVQDRGSGQESEKIIRFRSSLVPPDIRRNKNLEELLPLLYLQGISTGDFTDVLSALLGPDAQGLSAKTISRLKQQGCRRDNREAMAKMYGNTRQQRCLKFPKATARLVKDREELLAFYDFPAEHWPHLRTTHPIESTFAAVKLSTAETRGCLSRQTMLTIVFKLGRSAEKRWYRLQG